MEEKIFRVRLSDAVRKARLNHNHITKEEMDASFEGELSSEQLLLVEEYLKNLGIKIGDFHEEEEEPVPGGQDASYLHMYLDELSGLAKRTDEELLNVKKAALCGDETAKAAIVHDYLPKVVEIAKLYTGQGVALEDLIGEGNIGLMMGIELISCLESVEEIEGYLGKMVMDAMDSAIARGDEDREFDRQTLELVEMVASKAGELSDLLRRDVSVSELAEESGLAEEKILRALEMAGNKIEGIMVETEI